MLIDARTRKGPFFHLSLKAGAWCFTVCLIFRPCPHDPAAHLHTCRACVEPDVYLASQHYNNMYHPRCVIPREEGGMDAEYEQLCKRVAVINVAVERQVQVKGPDAERFVDMCITRKAAAIKVPGS